MRSRAPLALLEQILMLLVFAVAAVLCLQVFLWSDNASRRAQTQDEAILCAQTTAETVKSFHGDLHASAEALNGDVQDNTLRLIYDTMTVTCTVTERNDYLGRGEVTVTAADGTLVTLPVAWQEVSP